MIDFIKFIVLSMFNGPKLRLELTKLIYKDMARSGSLGSEGHARFDKLIKQQESYVKKYTGVQ